MFDCCYWGEPTYERGWDYIEKLSPHFSFKFITKRQPFELIKPQIEQCKLVILPYRFMAVRPPLTLIESMALGKCVITSEIGGNEEIVISGQNGFIRDFDRKNIVINLINYLLNSYQGEKERESKALLAKKTIEKLYNPQEYERIIKAYETTRV